METRINSLQSVVADPWVRPDQNSQETRSIKPVPRSDRADSGKIDKEKKDKEGQSKGNEIVPTEIQEVTDEIKSYLSDLNISLNFKVDDKTNNLVVQVLDDNGELIRQLPPEDVLKLREKLKELRGVLFEGKA